MYDVGTAGFKYCHGVAHLILVEDASEYGWRVEVGNAITFDYTRYQSRTQIFKFTVAITEGLLAETTTIPYELT